MSEVDWRNVEIKERSHVYLITGFITAVYVWAGIAGWFALGQPAFDSDVMEAFVIGCMAILLAHICIRKWLLPRIGNIYRRRYYD